VTCANCQHVSEPETTVRGLTICPGCLATLIAETGTRAIASDTTSLDQGELKALRTLRKQLRDAKGVEA
jgi:hypothetical protein